jgi:hypothetical protein
MAGHGPGGSVQAIPKCYAVARTPLLILLLTLLVLLAAALFASASHAADDGHDPLLTFYFARGADPDFFNILPELIRGEALFDDTYLYALGYFHPLTTPGGLQKVFDFLRVPNTRTGIEATGVKAPQLTMPGSIFRRRHSPAAPTPVFSAKIILSSLSTQKGQAWLSPGSR